VRRHRAFPIVAVVSGNEEGSEQRRGPWQTINRRIAYRNPWITVREDTVIRPDGLPGIYGVLECPLAVAIVALTNDQQVYVIGQYRYAIDRYSWEIPAGSANPGEGALMAAQRELREETGIVADRWTSLGHAYLSNSFTDQRMEFFLAEGLTPGATEPDATEQLVIMTIPFADALERVRSSQMDDGPSIVGLYRAWHRLLASSAR